MSDDQHTVVYVGGPAHGRIEARPGPLLDAPLRIEVPVLGSPPGDPIALSDLVQTHTAVYERVALADTPGRLAYVFMPGVVPSLKRAGRPRRNA